MLPTPGSPDFTPALIEALEDEPSLYGWELDGTLVAVILLALVVRRGGVIIDVPSGRRANAGIVRAARTASAVSPEWGLGSRISCCPRPPTHGMA